MSSKHQWISLLALCVIPILLLGDSLMSGAVLADAGLERSLPWSASVSAEEQRLPQVNYDTYRENLVYRVITSEALKQGRIPWWNPFGFSGSPFVALSHVEVLYPPNWVASQFSPYSAYGGLIVFHLMLAGLGMWCLLRNLAFEPLPAFVGSLVFMLNGMFATRHGHPQFVATACWLPYALLGVRWLVSGSRPAGALLVSVSIALSVLAGHPSVYVFATYLIGIWLLMELWLTNGPDARKQRSRIVGLFALAIVVGVGLASVQLLATVEYSELSARATRPRGVLLSLIPHWSHGLRMVFPHVTGTHLDGSYWSMDFTHPWAGNLYLGIAPLMLGILGAVKGDRRARILAGIALLVLAAIYVRPVYGLLYDLLPGFQFSRPDRISVIYFPVMSVLVAYGVKAAGDGGRQAWSDKRALAKFAAPWLLVMVALILLAWLTIPTLARQEHVIDPRIGYANRLLDQTLWAGALGLVSLAWLVAARAGWRRSWLPTILLLIVGVDLAIHFRHHVVVRDADRYFRTTPAIDFLQAQAGPFRIAKMGGWWGLGRNVLMPANTPAVYRLEDIHGFGPLHWSAWDDLFQKIDRGRRRNAWHLGPIRRVAALEHQVMDMLGVRFVLAEIPIPDTTLDLVYEGEILIYENSDYLPRAWFVNDYVVQPSMDDQIRALAATSVDIRQTVLLSATPRLSTSQIAGGRGEVELISRRFDWHQFRKTGDAGIVVFSQSSYAGWKVLDNGVERETLRANAVIQAIPVDAGEHILTFYYEPGFLTTGLRITGISAAVLVLLTAWWLRSNLVSKNSLIAESHEK